MGCRISLQNVEMLDILYIDKDVLVVNKPAGIPVETKNIGKTDLESMVKNELALRGNKEASVHIINRLDQPVSGIVLFALNPKAAAFLSKEMQENRMEKRYMAKVFGEFEEKEGTITDMLYKDSKNNCSMVLTSADPRYKFAKKAVLEYKETEEGLDIHLITGRHHQIRVQLSHSGHPILGDLKYGNEQSRAYTEEKGIKNLCLKAYSLEFNHPATMERIKIETDK